MLNAMYCGFTGNSATGSGFGNYGGAIANDGTAILGNSTFSNNQAAATSPGASGGGAIINGIVNTSASLTLNLDTFTGNSVTGGSQSFSGNIASGGAIFNEALAMVTGSTFTGNKATGGAATMSGGTANGGAIDNSYRGNLAISGSTFQQNSATGGMETSAQGSRGGNARGGAICSEGSSNVQLSITSSVFSSNTAAGGTASIVGGQAFGGAIYNGTTLTSLVNSVLAGNQAIGGAATQTNGQGTGGGLYTDFIGPATLINCTVSGNSANSSGGGLFINGPITLTDTIFAVNSAPSAPDIAGGATSKGYNLIGKTDGSSGWIGSDLTGTIAQPLNPLLAPLGDYGGPTKTVALLPGSPAIDAGITADYPGTTTAITTDQRGISRPRGSAPDIGAFESEGFTLIITGGNNQSAIVGAAFANPLQVTVTANNPVEPVVGGVITYCRSAHGRRRRADQQHGHDRVRRHRQRHHHRQLDGGKL